MSRDEAIDLAKRWAASKGIPWIEPTGAEFVPASKGHADAWLVTSNHLARGFQIIVSIDDQTRKVIQARTLGRNVQTWDEGSV